MWSKVRQVSLSDVRYLIHRHHSPLVEVRPSYIPNAGTGVFVKRPVEKNRVVCLYPGIYTPGIPKYADGCDETVNLAETELDSNPYILNLNTQGGYIDGAALVGAYGRRLDDNPSACANMINHRTKDSNVDWMPIHWSEVLDDLGYQDKHEMPPPNELRADGSPWYYDGSSQKVVSFPSSLDEAESKSLLYGAAFYAKRDMEYGEEILLDYKLIGPPYPSWAEDWYE